jgi:cyclopropane fatty-acyl-phospholipid synthase-like methyltransferase
MAQHKPTITTKSLPPFGYWEYYQELDILNPTSPETLLDIARTCQVNASSRILDVGSGKGTIALLWAKEFGCRVIGVDNLPRMILESRKKATELGLNDRVMFRIMDAGDIDTQFRESFDVVSCFGSMFIWGFQQGLQRLNRLISPGGSLVFSDAFFTDNNVDENFLKRTGYRKDEYPTISQMQEFLNIMGWEIIQTWVANDREWQHYLNGTSKALNWYNKLHPGIVNPFVESEKEWAACLKETNRKWIQFIHVVAKERR